MPELTRFEALTAREQAALQEKLWALLARRALLYTGGASTSLPKETAEDLLAGICFLLDIGPHTPPGRLRRLLAADLARRLDFGVCVAQGKLALARRRWAAACSGAPRVPCLALRDTLAELHGFFKRYDVRFFAHQIPCMIDYQLARPVPETLLGVDYVSEYLRRLQLENELLARFSPAELRGFYALLSPEPEETLMGLYEAAAAGLLGLALTGQPLRLPTAAPPRAALNKNLAPLPDAARREALEQAAQNAARGLALSPEGSAYLAQFAALLLPRLRAAWPDEADGVFWNWKD